MAEVVNKCDNKLTKQTVITEIVTEIIHGKLFY